MLFGLIMILNLEIGYLTPPVGLNLIVAMSAFKQNFGLLCQAAVPFIGLMLVCLVDRHLAALDRHVPGDGEVLGLRPALRPGLHPRPERTARRAGALPGLHKISGWPPQAAASGNAATEDGS